MKLGYRLTDLTHVLASLELEFLGEVINRLFEVQIGKSLPSGINPVWPQEQEIGDRR